MNNLFFNRLKGKCVSKIWLITAICIICAGCSSYFDDISNSNPVQKNCIYNPTANMFLNLLKSSEVDKNHFFDIVGNYDVFYELVEFKMVSMYGLCFVIPYGKKEYKQIYGAVFYPVGYYINSESGEISVGDQLHIPTIVNSDNLEKEIEITQRFLFSNYFNKFKERGFYVNNSLTSYMYLLGNTSHINYEKTSCMRPKKVQGIGHVGIDASIITIQIEGVYNINNEGSTIIGIHPNTMTNGMANAIETVSANYDYILHSHYINVSDYSSIRVEVALNSNNVNVDKVVSDIVTCFSLNLYRMSVNHSLQYYYEINYITENEKEKDSEYGTGGMDDSESRKEKDGTENCDEVKNSDLNAAKALSLVDLLKNAEKSLYGTTELYSFQDFINAIANASNIEHGINIENLPIGKGLAHLSDGTESSVEVRNTSTTEGHLHNHPRLSPPSPQDLFNVAKCGCDPSMPNYKGEFVYNYIPSRNVTEVYSVQVGNQDSMQKLYDALQNEIDPISHDFTKNGECRKMLEEAFGCLSENNLPLQLKYISDFFTDEEGVDIFKFTFDEDFNIEECVTYDIKKDKNNNVEFIKCTRKWKRN